MVPLYLHCMDKVGSYRIASVNLLQVKILANRMIFAQVIFEYCIHHKIHRKIFVCGRFNAFQIAKFPLHSSWFLRDR